MFGLASQFSLQTLLQTLARRQLCQLHAVLRHEECSTVEIGSGGDERWRQRNASNALAPIASSAQVEHRELGFTSTRRLSAIQPEPTPNVVPAKRR